MRPVTFAITASLACAAGATFLACGKTSPVSNNTPPASPVPDAAASAPPETNPCVACVTDNDCPSARCVLFGSEDFCAPPCGPGGVCASDRACVTVPDVAGGSAAVCAPRTNVTGATSEQTSRLAAANHTNTNPAIDSVADSALGTLVQEGAGTVTVSASQRLQLRAAWVACDPSAVSCTGSEGYAYLDPQSHEVVLAREAMRVSWFATGGSFDDDHTGRDATDTTPYTDNAWVAPASKGVVHLWVVLRDDRGGISWQSFVVDVT